ncbi:MAG: hypothetical protein AAF998_06835 [Bacteroidota bacterium]
MVTQMILKVLCLIALSSFAPISSHNAHEEVAGEIVLTSPVEGSSDEWHYELYTPAFSHPGGSMELIYTTNEYEINSFTLAAELPASVSAEVVIVGASEIRVRLDADEPVEIQSFNCGSGILTVLVDVTDSGNPLQDVLPPSETTICADPS